MPAGDDLAIVLFFLGAAMALALAGIHAAGWRHKLLIGTLFVSAAVSFAIAAGWIWIKPHAPELAAILGNVATSPVSWFVVLMFSLAVVLVRPQIPAVIPILRPSVRPAVSTPQQQPPPTEYGDLPDLIERWSNDHFPGSAVAQDTQAWNVVHRAKEDLKPLLRRALFSRFIGTASYVTEQAMTDRARYPSNPHPISYGAILARDVDLLRMFVDFSWETEHGQWTPRNRLFLAEFQNQTRGQRVFVPVLTEEDHPQPRAALQWGNGPLDEPMRRFPRPIFCRARLVLKGDDRTEQYYYFIVVTPRDENSTTISVDQKNLEFPDQWFAEDTRPVR